MYISMDMGVNMDSAIQLGMDSGTGFRTQELDSDMNIIVDMGVNMNMGS